MIFPVIKDMETYSRKEVAEILATFADYVEISYFITPHSSPELIELANRFLDEHYPIKGQSG